MLLRAPPTLSFLTGSTAGADEKFSRSLFLSSSFPTSSPVVCPVVKSGSSNHQPITGVVFEPFEEVKKELNLVPSVAHQSLLDRNMLMNLKLPLMNRSMLSITFPMCTMLCMPTSIGTMLLSRA